MKQKSINNQKSGALTNINHDRNLVVDSKLKDMLAYSFLSLAFLVLGLKSRSLESSSILSSSIKAFSITGVTSCIYGFFTSWKSLDESHKKFNEIEKDILEM